MPRLVWQDVADQRPPHLMQLLGQSAVASLSVRAIGPRTDIGEGYVTLGAGNRARVDRSRAGDAVDAGEQIGPNTGDALYRALTGHDPAGAAVLSLAIEDARTDADHLLYGSVPGAMGKAIEDAGRSAAVIANADGGPPTGVDQLHREAVLAMMDAEGRVGGGTVSRDLTVVDPAAPGGRRMDPVAVLDAFDAAWSGPDASDAVLVEMSDLERADRDGLPLTGPERTAGLASPLQQADAMLGELLQRVDLQRDRVIVVSPAAPGGFGRLTVFGLAGRGVEPGLARSATTRRPGYVTLPDVGATVLDSLGLPLPDSMNSTPITSSGGRRLDAGLAADLAIADVVARFRDRTVGPVSVVYIVLQVVTYGLTALALLSHRRALQGVVGFAALLILATPPITFLAGLFRYDRLGLAPFVVAVFVAAAVLAAIAAATRRIHPFLPALGLVALNWLLQVVDIGLGGRLQLSTPLGYSPIVAGRFQGLGNLAFAVLAASAVVLATGPLSLRRRVWPPDAALTEKTPRAFLVAAIAILTVTFVVDGYPAFGSDVGGVLATVPGLRRRHHPPRRLAGQRAQAAGRRGRHGGGHLGPGRPRPVPSGRPAHPPRPVRAAARQRGGGGDDPPQGPGQPVDPHVERVDVARPGVPGLRDVPAPAADRLPAPPPAAGAGRAGLPARLADRRDPGVRPQRLRGGDPRDDVRHRPALGHLAPPPHRGRPAERP